MSSGMRRKCDDMRRAARWRAAGCAVALVALSAGGWKAWQWSEELCAEGREWVSRAESWSEATRGWGADWRRMAEGGAPERPEGEGDGEWRRLRAARDDAETAERECAREALGALGCEEGDADGAEAAWGRVRKRVADAAEGLSAATEKRWVWWPEYAPAKGEMETALAEGEAAQSRHDVWAAARARVAETAEAEASWWENMRLKEEANSLLLLARTRAKHAEERKYEEDGGYGVRLAQMKESLRAGEQAHGEGRFEEATAAYGAVVDAASWMETNVPLREAARGARGEAESRKSAADAVEGERYGLRAYREGERAWEEGCGAFDGGRFEEASAGWKRAGEAWKTAETAAREALAKVELAEAREAFQTEEWGEAARRAGRALELATGEEESREAETLKSAAEAKLPRIKLRASVGGREVRATVTEGESGKGLRTPATVAAEKGKTYHFGLEHEEKGKRYAGRTTATGPDEGIAEAWVDLEDVTPTKVRLRATVGGKDVAARVASGDGLAGKTTPAEGEVASGGAREYSLAYETGGKRYAGKATVQAKLHETAEACVELADVTPTRVRLVATVGGKEVAAQVASGEGLAGKTTPAEGEVASGGAREYSLAYETGGKRYAGKATVQAKLHETAEARIELPDVTPTRVRLVATVGGKPVAATVTEGLAQSGRTTPVDVNVSETGGEYSFGMEFRTGHKLYTGRTTVAAAAHETTEARAELADVTPTKVRLVATAGGRDVAARVTAGPWGHGALTPAELAVPAGFGTCSMDWEENGKWYVWTGRAEAKEHETTEVRGLLAEVPLRAGTTMTLALPGGASMEMVWCPPGAFKMGECGFMAKLGWDSSAATPHVVRLTRGFWMAKTEVTQRQWASVMGTRPASHAGDDLPVENVTWDDCKEFCRRAGLGLQLPTEAQWEYACRAGSRDNYAGELDGMAWYDKNGGGQSHPVGRKEPNAWGLHDMHGNVWEWCSDWYGRITDEKAATDPAGPESGLARVCRGGGFDYDKTRCLSAYRSQEKQAEKGPSLGFRPVRTRP